MRDFSLRDYADYLIGGSLFLSAPAIPTLVANVQIVADFEQVLTLSIQACSLVLLYLRIKHQIKKDRDETES